MPSPHPTRAPSRTPRGSAPEMKDPLYQDQQQNENMANDPQIMAKVSFLRWAKFATGLAALVLIGAILIVWRSG